MRPRSEAQYSTNHSNFNCSTYAKLMHESLEAPASWGPSAHANRSCHWLWPATNPLSKSGENRPARRYHGPNAIVGPSLTKREAAGTMKKPR